MRLAQRADAMKFLSAAECKAYARRMGPEKSVLDRREVGRMKRVIDFAYHSRLQNGGPVATEIASCLGSFTSALLWTHGLVWGDRTQEPDAPADWICYGRWRAKLGAAGPWLNFPGNCLMQKNELSWQRLSSGQSTPDPTPSFSPGQPGSRSISHMMI